MTHEAGEDAEIYNPYSTTVIERSGYTLDELEVKDIGFGTPYDKGYPYYADDLTKIVIGDIYGYFESDKGWFSQLQDAEKEWYIELQTEKENPESTTSPLETIGGSSNLSRDILTFFGIRYLEDVFNVSRNHKLMNQTLDVQTKVVKALYSLAKNPPSNID